MPHLHVYLELAPWKATDSLNITKDFPFVALQIYSNLNTISFLQPFTCPTLPFPCYSFVNQKVLPCSWLEGLSEYTCSVFISGACTFSHIKMHYKPWGEGAVLIQSFSPHCLALNSGALFTSSESIAYLSWRGSVSHLKRLWSNTKTLTLVWPVKTY